MVIAPLLYAYKNVISGVVHALQFYACKNIRVYVVSAPQFYACKNIKAYVVSAPLIYPCKNISAGVEASRQFSQKKILIFGPLEFLKMKSLMRMPKIWIWTSKIIHDLWLVDLF